MRPEELRMNILKALSEWDKSGRSTLIEAHQLAKKFNVSTHDIVDQFDIGVQW